AGNRRRGVLELRSRARQGAADGIADRLDLHDVLFDHRVRWQWFHCVMLDPVAPARLAELKQLDRRRADVDTDQVRFLRRKKSHGTFPLPRMCPNPASSGRMRVAI